ncbi:MAG TPA: DUF1236 domain-containing protein [Beijerinckiaceae bacterium]
MIDRYMLAFTAVLFSTASALSQGEPRTPTPDITELPVTSAQQDRIRALVPRDALRQATLPPGIELREIPPELELGSYRYALVGDVIVIVDPDSGYIIKAFQ